MRLLPPLLSRSIIPAETDLGLVPTNPVPAPIAGAPTIMDVAERIGSENETVRNLLMEIDVRFGAIENLRDSFEKVVEPLYKMADALGQETLQNAELRLSLSELRVSHQALGSEQQKLLERTSRLEEENRLLSDELNRVREAKAALDGDKLALTAEVSTLCSSLAGVEKELHSKTSDVVSITEDRRLLNERHLASEKRMLELGATVAIERERVSLLEGEKASLQVSLDRALERAAEMSRQLAKFEKLIAEAGVRLEQLTSGSAALEEERRRLSAVCDDINHRRETEVEALRSQLNAARSRSAVAENQCVDLRRKIAEQAVQLKDAETKLGDAQTARVSAEEKATAVTSVMDEHQNKARKLEEDRSSLLRRSSELSLVIVARDHELEEAQDRIKALTNRVDTLKAEAGKYRAKAEEQIEQLRTDVDRSRMERAVVEGALESTRADLTRLRREAVTAQPARMDSQNSQVEQRASDMESSV